MLQPANRCPEVYESPDWTMANTFVFRNSFGRPNGWYTTQGTAHISVPAAKLKIEALRGLQTELTVKEIDMAEAGAQDVTLRSTSVL